MGELVNLVFNNHKKVLYKGLWDSVQNNFQTNVSLVGKSESKSQIHSLMLSIFCPSVKMSSGNELCLSRDGVELENDDVKSLIEFMYRGKVSVKEERLFAMKTGAQILGLRCLVGQIEKAMLQAKVRNFTKRSKRLKASLNESKSAPSTVESNSLMKEEDEEKLRKAVTSGVSVKSVRMMSEEDASEENEDEMFVSGGKQKCKNPKNKRTSTIDDTAAEYYHPVYKMYVCKHCGKSFKVARNFLIHTSCHENPSLRLKCRLCEHETSGKNGLRAHMVSKHHVDLDGTKLEKNIKCPDCPYICVAQFQLKNHRFQSHSKPYKCDVCGYCCASAAVLSRHVQAVHQNERPYMCESCGFRAKTWQVLRNHVKMHDGKKVICSYCGQSLTVNSFPEHLKLHTSDRKPHVCHLCAYATRKKYCLKMHLRNVHKMEMERGEERNVVGTVEPRNEHDLVPT